MKARGFSPIDSSEQKAGEAAPRDTSWKSFTPSHPPPPPLPPLMLPRYHRHWRTLKYVYEKFFFFLSLTASFCLFHQRGTIRHAPSTRSPFSARFLSFSPPISPPEALQRNLGSPPAIINRPTSQPSLDSVSSRCLTQIKCLHPGESHSL